MNFVGLLIIVGFCFFTGVVVYAMFYDCDPITSGVCVLETLIDLLTQRTDEV